MVIYVEACESGSMFKGLLPDNINSKSHYSHVCLSKEECLYAEILIQSKRGSLFVLLPVLYIP